VNQFDANRVRIELCNVMSLVIEDGAPTMRARQGAEIWLGDGEGKISRSRKPHVTLVDDSRSGLLVQIADWMGQEDDPGLSKLAADFRAASKGGAS
jgi:hypothetical protein